MSHTATLVAELTVLVLAIFLGFEVISKVPTMLHTPLMSGTNAIHGIVLVGAIVVAGLPHQTTWIRVVALDWEDEIVSGACVTRKEVRA